MTNHHERILFEVEHCLLCLAEALTIMILPAFVQRVDAEKLLVTKNLEHMVIRLHPPAARNDASIFSIPSSMNDANDTYDVHSTDAYFAGKVHRERHLTERVYSSWGTAETSSGTTDGSSRQRYLPPPPPLRSQRLHTSLREEVDAAAIVIIIVLLRLRSTLPPSVEEQPRALPYSPLWRELGHEEGIDT